MVIDPLMGKCFVAMGSGGGDGILGGGGGFNGEW
jgi:hypothetical protein